MAQRRPRDQRVVRNRRVAIYTFLLILTLFYISAHRTVQKEREMEALRAETAEEGPGEQVKELVEGWPEGLPGARVYKERGEMDADGGLKILPEDMWCLILTNAEKTMRWNWKPFPVRSSQWIRESMSR